MRSSGDHDRMADDELDELYRVTLPEFTALRARLAASARKRGDAAAAKRISAARKPTRAAWVVNQLVHDEAGARGRLTDLGDRMRAAHAAMDGDAIRELTRQQRRLVEELTSTAFVVAGLPDPSATLREDVAATLQAAVADPGVAKRLGRLVKAEQWAGFGEFGSSAVVSGVRSVPRPAKAAPKKDDTSRARAVLAEAERAKADADQATSDRQSELAMARLRLDDARHRVELAERDLQAAEEAYRSAKDAGRRAAELVRKARSELQ